MQIHYFCTVKAIRDVFNVFNVLLYWHGRSCIKSICIGRTPRSGIAGLLRKFGYRPFQMLSLYAVRNQIKKRLLTFKCEPNY